MSQASQDLPDAAIGRAAPDPAPILQLGLGFWASKTLLSAVELGVFTELAHEPLDAETLRARLGLHRRGTLDFLDALVALGMLQRDQGGYVDTPATALFLDRESPAYIGGLLEMANDRLYAFWASLTEGLRTGAPQNEIKTGGDFFSELYGDQQRLRQFMRSMTGLSTGASHAIAAKFPWHEHETFVDVGTARGRAAGDRRPRPRAHLGRRLRPARGRAALRGLRRRLRALRPAAFPSRGLLHRPAAARRRACHGPHPARLGPPAEAGAAGQGLRALPDGGALIVFDAIIDDERRTNAFGLLMSLNMLIEMPGGFDYTGADCQRWMREVGFRTTRVEHLAGPDSMVVGIK